MSHGPRVRNAIPRAAGWAALAAIPVVFLAVFFMWPVANLIGRGVVPGGALDLSGFADVLGSTRTWRLIGYTLGQAAAGTVACVVLGVPGAYVLYRCRFPGQALWRGLVAVPFVLPTVVVGVAFRTLLVDGGLLGFAHLDGTFAAVVVALVFFNYSVVVRTVGAVWEQLDPRTEQVALTLGATRWRVWRTITLPALIPAITSAASVVFLFCATAFGVVLILGGSKYGTVETEIWVQTTQFLDLRAAAVLSIVQLAVVCVSLAVAARTRSGREHAGMAGRTGSTIRPRASASRQTRHDLGAAGHPSARWRSRLSRPAGDHGATGHPSGRSRRRALRPRGDLAAFAVTALVTVGLIGLPLGALVVRSLHTPTGWGFDNYARLATAGSPGTLSVTVWQALGNSLRTATAAALIAISVGAILAYLLSRRPRTTVMRRVVGVLDGAFMMPLGVSAVTVGFGFLITLPALPGADLRTSGALVPIAQATVALPLVVRTVLPVMRAADPRLPDAAATLGARPWRVLATIEWPVAARPLGLALGFALAVSLGEFGATAFLARPQNATLPVVIFRLIGRPGAENFGMALAASVVLAVVTTVIMAVAERLRGDGWAGEL